MVSGPLGFTVETTRGVDEVDHSVRECLAKEGFGVLTEIDVRATLQAKLGVDFRPYRILGACNPSLAYQALSTESMVGLLLPCNVVVEATADGTRVGFLDPIALLGLASNDRLRPIAEEAASKLASAAKALEASLSARQ